MVGDVAASGPALSVYPRIYRPVRFWTSMPFWSMLLSLAGATDRLIHAYATFWPWLISGVVLGGFVLFAASLKMVLYADRIERVGLFGVQAKMDLADIAGRYGERRLVSKHDRKQLLPLLRGCRKDAVWDAWMAGVPDFEVKEQAELLADPSLGATQEERIARRRSALQAGNTLFVVSCILGATASFLRGDLAILGTAALLLLPWIGLLHLLRVGPVLTQFLMKDNNGGLANRFSSHL